MRAVLAFRNLKQEAKLLPSLNIKNAAPVIVPARPFHQTTVLPGSHYTGAHRSAQNERIARARTKNITRRQLRRKQLKSQGQPKPFKLPEGPIEHWKPPHIKVPIVNLDNQQVGEVELPYSVFGQPIRRDVIHRVVEWQRNKRRQGTSKTKSKAEVSGSNRKVRPQKKMGKARIRTRRAPQFKGGGHALSKRPRSFETDLPKKIRRLGMKIALSAKQIEGSLVVLDKASFATHKTKNLQEKLDALKVRTGILIHAPDELDPNLALAARNIKHFHFLPTHGANVYDIVRTDTLFVTVEAVNQLIRRLEPPPKVTFPGRKNEEKQTQS